MYIIVTTPEGQFEKRSKSAGVSSAGSGCWGTGCPPSRCGTAEKNESGETGSYCRNPNPPCRWIQKYFGRKRRVDACLKSGWRNNDDGFWKLSLGFGGQGCAIFWIPKQSFSFSANNGVFCISPTFRRAESVTFDVSSLGSKSVKTCKCKRWKKRGGAATMKRGSGQNFHRTQVSQSGRCKKNAALREKNTQESSQNFLVWVPNNRWGLRWPHKPTKPGERREKIHPSNSFLNSIATPFYK